MLTGTHSYAGQHEQELGCEPLNLKCRANWIPPALRDGRTGMTRSRTSEVPRLSAPDPAHEVIDAPCNLGCAAFKV